MAKLRFEITEDCLHKGHQAHPWNGPLSHAINPHLASGVSAECRTNDVVFRHHRAVSSEDGCFPEVAVAWPQEVQNLLGSHAALRYERYPWADQRHVEPQDHWHPEWERKRGQYVRDEKGRKRLLDDHPPLTEHVKPLTVEIEVPDWAVGR